MDEVDKEKEELKQKKSAEQLERLEKEMVPVEEDKINFINPQIQKKVEEPKPYCTMAIPMYKFQRKYVESIQRHLGFKQKSNFVRHCILSFCWNQKKILDVETEVDEKIKVAYEKWRRKYFIKKMKLKEKVEELKRMAPAQDEGDEDPFTAEDLME